MRDEWQRQGFVSTVSPSAFPASSRSTTSRSRLRRDPATRSAARTARGRARLGSCWQGSTARMRDESASAASPSGSASPTDALKSGVAMVHQELSFCENLSVAENLCLGSLPSTRGFVSKREMRRRAEAMLAPIDAGLDVTRAVGSLTVGQQQMLQIAVGDRAGRAADRLRRADEQPVAARSRAALRDHRPASRARRDLHLRQPPPRRNLPAVRHRSPCCATADTWRRSPSPRSTGRRSSR